MTAHESDEPELGKARKAIQIAATLSADATDSELYALCDDGTIWLRTWGDGGPGSKWRLVRAVPTGPAVDYTTI